MSKKKVKKTPKKRKKPEVAYTITYSTKAVEIEEDEYDDPVAQAEMDALQLGPVSDDVRFVNPCPSCTEPEVYESFDGGRRIVVSLGVSKRKVCEIIDTGGGITIKYESESRTTHLDYGTLDFLLRGAQIMDAAQKSSIFGDHWWTGPKNNVGNFNFLLQCFKEQVKTEKG